MTDRIDVGPNYQTNAVAYGEGSVWVTYYDDTGGHLVRLDPATGETVADIPIEVFPTWENGGGGLTFGDGSVWITGSSPRSHLLRLDPSTNQVIADIDLGPGFGADVAVAESGVWVMSVGPGGSPGTDDDRMRVDRIDPTTDQIVATIPLHFGYGHFLVAVGGSVVAQTYETHNGGINGGIYLNFIDPETNTVTATKQITSYVLPDTGDGQLWAETVTGLTQLDPRDGTVIRTFALENTGDTMAVGDGGVWFLDPSQRAAIHRFNPDTGTVDVSVDLPTGPSAIVLSPTAVWLLIAYEGKLIRVDLG
ncbi:MAG: hypothetical protein M3P11_09470 [Actinomycetota bacterium]|nr:hypothetical protein [Actinomycetota bacterium]